MKKSRTEKIEEIVMYTGCTFLMAVTILSAIIIIFNIQHTDITEFINTIKTVLK